MRSRRHLKSHDVIEFAIFDPHRFRNLKKNTNYCDGIEFVKFKLFK